MALKPWILIKTAIYAVDIIRSAINFFCGVLTAVI